MHDHGPGIRSDDQVVIFEKFGRVVGPASKPGTGLGLYIARSIAETHGGTIAVSSAPGLGATFTVARTLPTALGAACLPLRRLTRAAGRSDARSRARAARSATRARSSGGSSTTASPR